MPTNDLILAISACKECAEICRKTFAQGLDDPDFRTLVRAVVLARDCSFFCDTAVFLMENGSEFIEDYARFCGKACATCADECSKFDKPTLRACADACRNSADLLAAVAQRLTNN